MKEKRSLVTHLQLELPPTIKADSKAGPTNVVGGEMGESKEICKTASKQGVGGVLPSLVHICHWLWNKPTILPPQIHACTPSIPNRRRAAADNI